MEQHSQNTSVSAEGSAFPWILEHLMAYPGTYEIPLRTMYTLNSTSQTPSRASPSNHVMGNAFQSHTRMQKDAGNFTTATAAAQLKANLMTHISQQHSQPTSLPPSFVTSFVRKCFAVELEDVQFPQALSAMDYLKDLETRRRNEFLAALGKLNVDRKDFASREIIAKKYPRVLAWIDEKAEQERRVEALYTHIYLGLRRWVLINEMSTEPFNKSSCIAMLNTLYPPTGLASSQFVPPTAQLTATILSEQRKGFFRYITAVERNGPQVLLSLIRQHKRDQEETGWPKVREDLDNYLRAANTFIDECLDVFAPGISPQSISSAKFETDEEHKRKVDSGISFSSGNSSNRSSGQSNVTRPSTSSSLSTHSRHTSREKPSDKHLSSGLDDDETLRAPGSTLERIARELRKIGSRTNIREEAKSRPVTPQPSHDTPMQDADSPPATPGRGLRLRRSLRSVRSTSRMRSGSTNSRPVSRAGSISHHDDVPAFNPEEMRAQRAAWEAQQQPTKY